MQQLNLPTLRNSLESAEDKVIINLPLPSSTEDTNAFIKQFARCTQSTVVSSEWGADRFQSTLEKNNTRFYLHIEWLCEAMWIEGHGQSKQIICLLLP